ncbi:hypothetical protein DFP72DRAFT_885150 [Ephemerocybe angulata]|uniref:Uncharacterized protein n=1 Tax=Ephemerocybe angulata TaxID=980116 RepID=A0A8H6I6C8_9AGAR|nr:hypothetical protein DFP72DRAFT_885150 [Tulosesus angulatus]
MKKWKGKRKKEKSKRKKRRKKKRKREKRRRKRDKKTKMNSQGISQDTIASLPLPLLPLPLHAPLPHLFLLPQFPLPPQYLPGDYYAKRHTSQRPPLPQPPPPSPHIPHPGTRTHTPPAQLGAKAKASQSLPHSDSSPSPSSSLYRRTTRSVLGLPRARRNLNLGRNWACARARVRALLGGRGRRDFPRACASERRSLRGLSLSRLSSEVLLVLSPPSPLTSDAKGMQRWELG